MYPYYCLEIDAGGLLLDYEVSYPRLYQNEWQWPKGSLTYELTTTDSGYEVSGKIQLSTLQTLGILKDKRMTVGLFRAEIVDVINQEPEYRWISWVDPKSPEVNFHVPTTFGAMLFE